MGLAHWFWWSESNKLWYKMRMRNVRMLQQLARGRGWCGGLSLWSSRWWRFCCCWERTSSKLRVHLRRLCRTSSSPTRLPYSPNRIARMSFLSLSLLHFYVRKLRFLGISAEIYKQSNWNLRIMSCPIWLLSNLICWLRNFQLLWTLTTKSSIVPLHPV